MLWIPEQGAGFRLFDNSAQIHHRDPAGDVFDNSQIVKQFNVNYIATGSIRSSGNRIRISVELTDPNLGNSIWSERYDRTMDDIFDVQDEIVRKIMVALVGKLELVSLERAKRKPTED